MVNTTLLCYTLPSRGNEVGGVGEVRFESRSVASEKQPRRASKKPDSKALVRF